MRNLWLTTLFVTLLVGSAHAQIGIYATFQANQRSQTPNGSGTQSGWLYGPTFGLYDDLLHLGPLALGGDLRGEFVNGNGYTTDAGLFGIRLALHPAVLPIKPYIEGFGGVAHTTVPGSSASSNNPEYRIAGGLDFTILPRIDWRIIEIGRGSLLDYDTGGQTNSIYSYSTGLVLRIP